MIKSKVLNEILDTGFSIDSSGEKKAIHSGISREEVKAIIEVITSNPSICRTIEIGCAYGVSSLAISESLLSRSNACHTIIDPFQTSHWNGIGINNLNRGGFTKYKFLEEYSEIALPKLLQEENKYDFALIDGYHTFDHTLLNFLFS